jgi:hypothetical protein
MITANTCSWEKLPRIPMTLAFRYVREKIPHTEERIRNRDTYVTYELIQNFLANGWTGADLAGVDTTVLQLVRSHSDFNQLREDHVVSLSPLDETGVETEPLDASKSKTDADVEQAYKYVLEMMLDNASCSPKTLISTTKKRGTQDRDSDLTAVISSGAQARKKRRKRKGGKL